MRNPWEDKQLTSRLTSDITALPVASFKACGTWRKWKRAVENLFSHFPQFIRLLCQRRHPNEALIAAMVSGGVGDLLRFNAFFCTLTQQYPNVKIDIYTTHPTAKLIFAGLRGVRAVAHERLYPWFESRYDAYFDMGQIIVPDFKTEVFPIPLLKQVADEWTERVHQQYQQHGYFSFAQFIDLAQQRNWNFLEMLGRTGGLVGVSRAVPSLHLSPAKNPWAGVRYITFNTGWNKHDRLAKDVSMPTKCWPTEHWTEWVRLFRNVYPQIEVLQIGESNAPRIEGANTSLLGRTTFTQVASILKDSLLHIDCDCGLMHLSYALGVPAVILFGPTNGPYLTYPNHTMILSPRCGNCWHLTPTWDQFCTLYPKPVCMKSITPQMVLEAVQKRLNSII